MHVLRPNAIHAILVCAFVFVNLFIAVFYEPLILLLVLVFVGVVRSCPCSSACARVRQLVLVFVTFSYLNLGASLKRAFASACARARELVLVFVSLCS